MRGGICPKIVRIRSSETEMIERLVQRICHSAYSSCSTFDDASGQTLE